MRSRFSAVLAVLLLCFSLPFAVSACGARRDVPVGAILSAMLSCEADCPAGVIYTTDAEEGEEGYFSTSLCIALYGDGEVPAEWEQVAEFAIFLTAARHPCEFAVFRCRSSDGAKEVSELCARRLAVLRNYFRGEDYECYTSGGRVVILGDLVIMAVSADADVAVEEGRGVIR